MGIHKEGRGGGRILRNSRAVSVWEIEPAAVSGKDGNSKLATAEAYVGLKQIFSLLNIVCIHQILVYTFWEGRKQQAGHSRGVRWP